MPNLAKQVAEWGKNEVMLCETGPMNTLIQNQKNQNQQNQRQTIVLFRLSLKTL